MPKVSVIIPCYNQTVFLNEALQSVYAQSYSDYEVIIVDDGSTEELDVEEISYNKLNTTVYRTANKGVSAARNFAIRKSCGLYILPLDADDKIHEDYLKEAVYVLDKNAVVKMVCCNARHFGEESDVEILPRFDKRKLLQQNLFFNSSIFRKEAFINAGMYDEAFLTGWEDWDLYLRLINCAEEVYYIDQPYFFHRLREGSRNASLQAQKLEKVEQQLYLKHITKYMEEYPTPISLIRNYEYLLEEQQQYEHYKNSLHQSLSYRIGNLILSPVKWFAKIGKPAK